MLPPVPAELPLPASPLLPAVLVVLLSGWQAVALAKARTGAHLQLLLWRLMPRIIGYSWDVETR